jgi:hypothetical protein
MTPTIKFKWENLNPTPDPDHGVPCERSSHGLSLLKGGKALILYGGENVARTPLDPLQSTWAAEEKDGVWSWRCISHASASESSAQCPPARVAHAQCAYDDNTVYAFGGRAGIQMEEAAMNDLWKLDCSGEPGTETWSVVKPDLKNGDPPPEPRSFHKMLCLGTNLYVFGGCGAGRLADLYRFDVLKSTWHILPASSLRGRGGANFMPFDSDKILGVVAGFCGEESNDGQLFDIAAEKWNGMDLSEQLSGLRPRSVCISASYPSLGVSVIFGGEVDPSAKGHEGAGGFENDIVLLDEKTAKYLSTTAALAEGEVWPETRGWSDGASVDDVAGIAGKLYIYGGLSGDDAKPIRLSDLWCLNIQK